MPVFRLLGSVIGGNAAKFFFFHAYVKIGQSMLLSRLPAQAWRITNVNEVFDAVIPAASQLLELVRASAAPQAELVQVDAVGFGDKDQGRVRRKKGHGKGVRHFEGKRGAGEQLARGQVRGQRPAKRQPEEAMAGGHESEQAGPIRGLELPLHR